MSLDYLMKQLIIGQLKQFTPNQAAKKKQNRDYSAPSTMMPGATYWGLTSSPWFPVHLTWSEAQLSEIPLPWPM